MKKRRHLGQSLIEFALIIPLVLFLLFGFFDLGRAVFYYSSLSNAVREGTRYAIVDTKSESGPFENNIKFMNDYSFGVPDVNVHPDTACPAAGPCTFSSPDGDLVVTITRLDITVSITATYTFTPVTPGINLIAPSGITLEVQSTMRISPHAS